MSHGDHLQEGHTEEMTEEMKGEWLRVREDELERGPVLHLAEGHLLLTDGATVAQEPESRRKVPVELDGLQNIPEDEAPARQGRQQQEELGSVRREQSRHLKKQTETLLRPEHTCYTPETPHLQTLQLSSWLNLLCTDRLSPRCWSWVWSLLSPSG